MATVSIYLITTYQRKDGTYPIKFKISYGNSRAFYIPTNISVRESQWNGSRVTGQNSAMANAKISNLRTRIGVALEKCAPKLKGMPTKEAHRIFEYYLNGAGSYSANEFIGFFKSVMNAKDKKKTSQLYKLALDKLVEFSEGASLSFESINYGWLVRFQSWMTREGLSPNTQAIYFQCIRKVFNEAINEDLISMDIYPFRKFKFRKERTRRRSLTVEQLQLFRDYPCLPQYERYRDIFMLIFYLGGINMVDLAFAKDITPDGYIDYRREKTREYCRIKVEPEAMRIIEKYRGKKYVLDINERYTDYRTFLGLMNKGLKKIGPIDIVPDKLNMLRKYKHKPLFPDLSTYWARHTVATIAVQLNIHEKVIGKILGHADNSINGWYEQVYQKQADEAMRKIIDFVASPPEPQI